LPKRKVDDLAGPGSFADKLRKRREAIEKGDLENANEPFRQAEESEERKASDKDELDDERIRTYKKHLPTIRKKVYGE
jgi:hypothetical protein